MVIFREIIESRMADKCLQAAMAALRREPKSADYRVVVGEEVIMAHQFLLVARLPFFEAAANWPEVEGRKDMVIRGRSAEAVKEAINFMYGINLTDVEGLLDIAEFFQMSDFKTKVEESIKVTSENFKEMTKIADIYGAKVLEGKCAAYMAMVDTIKRYAMKRRIVSY